MRYFLRSSSPRRTTFVASLVPFGLMAIFLCAEPAHADVWERVDPPRIVQNEDSRTVDGAWTIERSLRYEDNVIVQHDRVLRGDAVVFDVTSRSWLSNIPAFYRTGSTESFRMEHSMDAATVEYPHFVRLEGLITSSVLTQRSYTNPNDAIGHVDSAMLTDDRAQHDLHCAYQLSAEFSGAEFDVTWNVPSFGTVTYTYRRTSTGSLPPDLQPINGRPRQEPAAIEPVAPAANSKPTPKPRPRPRPRPKPTPKPKPQPDAATAPAFGSPEELAQNLRVVYSIDKYHSDRRHRDAIIAAARGTAPAHDESAPSLRSTRYTGAHDNLTYEVAPEWYHAPVGELAQSMEDEGWQLDAVLARDFDGESLQMVIGSVFDAGFELDVDDLLRALATENEMLEPPFVVERDGPCLCATIRLDGKAIAIAQLHLEQRQLIFAAQGSAEHLDVLRAARNMFVTHAHPDESVARCAPMLPGIPGIQEETP